MLGGARTRAGVMAPGSFILALLLGAFPAHARVLVSQAVRFDVSPPLRELVQQAQSEALASPAIAATGRTHPLYRLPVPQTPALRHDRALQGTANIPLRAKVVAQFQGVGLRLGLYTPASTPPDTTGAAGATQFVEWVNTDFAVFDKATGAVLMGPAPGDSLWKGFGGDCETRNDGDPIVEYDKAAGRWVLSQFTTAPPFFECVALSRTSDATGTYNRYAFDMGGKFGDYPHVGVWPDGYYFSFNMFEAGGLPDGKAGPFIGGRTCVFDRTAMLAGMPATQECFDSPSTGGMVPSDWDGTAPPPVGSPNYFVQFGFDQSSGRALLNLYKLHADFADPAQASFSQPVAVPVAFFVPACQETEPQPIASSGPDTNGEGCIPQRGTKQKLDELSDRMMYRAAYRNFGDHESLVATHTVARVVRGTDRIRIRGAAIRWYELRGLSTSPTIFQQGTYGPNQDWRWMPSIGMDGAGDIAVGYSLSSRDLHPGIAVTGRIPGDPAGQMEQEGLIKRGRGSQLGENRWGDYSAMSIDPADDCTFWYATEYMSKTAPEDNWSTWIAAFKFRRCR